MTARNKFICTCSAKMISFCDDIVNDADETT